MTDATTEFNLTCNKKICQALVWFCQRYFGTHSPSVPAVCRSIVYGQGPPLSPMYNLNNSKHEVLPHFFSLEPSNSLDSAVPLKLSTTAVVLSPSAGNSLLEAMVRSRQPFIASRMGLGSEPIACHSYLEHLSYK